LLHQRQALYLTLGGQGQWALVVGEHRCIVRAGAQVLQLLGLAPDLVAGGPDDAAGFVGEFLGGRRSGRSGSSRWRSWLGPLVPVRCGFLRSSIPTPAWPGARSCRARRGIRSGVSHGFPR